MSPWLVVIFWKVSFDIAQLRQRDDGVKHLNRHFRCLLNHYLLLISTSLSFDAV
jgi:hypothetical protein